MIRDIHAILSVKGLWGFHSIYDGKPDSQVDMTTLVTV
jgi:hypothetical protein